MKNRYEKKKTLYYRIVVVTDDDKHDFVSKKFKVNTVFDYQHKIN